MFQISFCSTFPIATGDNNDSKDNDACSIQDNSEITASRATPGKTLPVVGHIYSTGQQGNQQKIQPQKKQEKKN
eukprot:7398554-Ditylum_brightwellii.AAC.1